MGRLHDDRQQKDQLWENFRQGDKSAFETIYRQQAARLISYGSKITRDLAIVEDCIQDLFIELWKGRENLSCTSSVKFYLFKALRYKIQRTISKRSNIVNQPIENLFYTIKNSSAEDTLIEMEVQSEQMRHLRETLEKLPERQREAVILRYYHNFSNEEIAGIMGVNYHSACKNVYAGIQKLKENLKMAVMSVSVIALKSVAFLSS
jgi:RNA polymerase sigma factor (sigma-70 family)